jgi:putative ABC transport system permease protein
VLRRKTIREIGSAKWMFLAITGIIVVGVLCFVVMRSLYHNLRTAQADYYAQCRMADFWIDLKKAPVAELAQLAHLPGIAEWQTRVRFYATVDLPDVPKPLSGMVLSLPDHRQDVINGIVLRSGSHFSPVRANEVIVGEAFARAHDLAPGMRIHMLLGNRRQELVIIGTAISSEFVYLVRPGTVTPDPYHFGVFYIKRRFAEEIFDMDGAANQVVGLLQPGPVARHEAVLARAERMLEPFGVVATTLRKDQTSHLSLSSEIEGLGVFAALLPAIFLAVAALVLGVLMARLADSQRAVLGTLKAIGYSNAAVARHMLGFGLIVGTVGGLIGCLAGYWMAGGMTSMYTQFFEFPRLQNHAYPLIYVAGMFISIVCATAGSWRGARAAIRLRPAEAMRPRPPVRGGKIALERLGGLWQRLSFPARMALRNVVRNRARTAVGLLATAVGTSLMVVGFISVEAMHYLVEFQFEKVLRSDIDLAFESERSAAALLDARQLPGVDYAEPILQVPCTWSVPSQRRDHRSGVRRTTDHPPRPRRPAAPGARTRPGHDPPYGQALTCRGWRPCCGHTRQRQSAAGGGTDRRDRRKLPRSERLCQYRLPEPFDRRIARIDRRATGRQSRSGRPQDPLPAAETNASPDGRQRPHRDDRQYQPADARNPKHLDHRHDPLCRCYLVR